MGADWFSGWRVTMIPFVPLHFPKGPDACKASISAAVSTRLYKATSSRQPLSLRSQYACPEVPKYNGSDP